MAEASLLPESSAPKVHLIRTTYGLIGEKGVHRVALEEIAAKAGVSKGIILYYFKTKENLVLSTMEWVLSEVAERIRAALVRARTPEGKIRAMLDVIFATPESNRRFYLTYLELVAHASRSQRFGRLSATFRSIVNGLYAEVIRVGVEEGRFKVDHVDEAALSVRAIIDGLFLEWLQEDGWEKAHRRYRERTKAAVLTYLGAAAG
ncbi:MAG TPA: TetR/AcrR family transcriptional regulator [Candidatus Dormibacteraeota bacterium]|nr:TetR/AcrR family transcriptional regulator [Candidatus Dormibacteraeota bacterium]